ncbi:MAG TPA: c-type cytochrome [Candidatus Acidoferrum sp.]|nr:c-type cytochrome [Candidatus Acidoferrum sp.]
MSDCPKFNSFRLRQSRLERLARLIGVVLLVGSLLGILVAWLAKSKASGGAIELVARQPSAGGWSRDRIVVNRGERVRLRIRSEDVVHGFAIGRLGVDVGPIEPGKTTIVEFVADQAGEFTFYCTTWCDPNHPRMRGTLEVRDAGEISRIPSASAQDVVLRDLDMPRDAGAIPFAPPSATRGAALYAERCAACHGERGQGTTRELAISKQELFQDVSPVDMFRMLRGDVVASLRGDQRSKTHAEFARGWSDQDRWDGVAYLWSLGTTLDRLDLGRRLFSKNCAACHGERGTGDGPGGKYQPKKPADFTDARRMLAGTRNIYTAKIRRGGMGTGMPYWGNIFTEKELSALVDYLWTFFQRGYEDNETPPGKHFELRADSPSQK